MTADFADRLRSALPHHITIDAPLAAGGQGTVYRGHCNGVPAAIKLYNDRTELERVDRECNLLRSLSCPHVVRLIEHFDITIDTDSVRIVVYEFHPGGDLMKLLSPAAPPVPEAELMKIGLDVGMGITTLWGSRIVHRDVKPANIVKASDGRYLLVDVGLARHLDLATLTAVNAAPGTRGYRSPEQAKGRKLLTINSDIYSLGITLFVLAAKKHPFGGADITKPTPIDFSAMTASRPLSDRFVSVVRQMLHITPHRRTLDIITSFSEGK